MVVADAVVVRRKPCSPHPPQSGPPSPLEKAKDSLHTITHPPRGGHPVSLRLGHATALTSHRDVIHYRVAASLPQGKV